MRAAAAGPGELPVLAPIDIPGLGRAPDNEDAAPFPGTVAADWRAVAKITIPLDVLDIIGPRRLLTNAKLRLGD